MLCIKLKEITNLEKLEIIKTEYNYLIDSIYAGETKEEELDELQLNLRANDVIENYVDQIINRYKYDTQWHYMGYKSPKEYEEEYGHLGEDSANILNPYEEEVYSVYCNKGNKLIDDMVKFGEYLKVKFDGNKLISTIVGLLTYHGTNYTKNLTQSASLTENKTAFRNIIKNNKFSSANYLNSLLEIKDLVNYDFDLVNRSKKELEVITYVIEERIKDLNEKIKYNTPEPSWSRERYNGEYHTEDTTRPMSNSETTTVLSCETEIKALKNILATVKKTIEKQTEETDNQSK